MKESEEIKHYKADSDIIKWKINIQFSEASFLKVYKLFWFSYDRKIFLYLILSITCILNNSLYVAVYSFNSLD